MNVIIQCAQWAAEGHKGQVRKFSGRPYIVHPDQVALQVMKMPAVTDIVVGASFMHDVKEDCRDFWDSIEPLVPTGVVELVNWLTNPSKDHHKLPYAKRKKMDRDHLAKAPYWVKVIKYVDRIANVNDLCADHDKVDEDFRRLYASESRLLRTALGRNWSVGLGSELDSQPFVEEPQLESLDEELILAITNLEWTYNPPANYATHP